MLDQLSEAWSRWSRRASQQFIHFLEDDGLTEDKWAENKAHESAREPMMHWSSLSELLQHSAYLSEEKLFVLETPSQIASSLVPQRTEAVAFTLELNPLSGAGDAVDRTLRSMLAMLPKDTGVQVTLAGDPRIDDNLARYVNLRKLDHYRVQAERRAQWYLKGAYSTIFKGFNYRLREIRLIMSFTFPVDDITVKSELDAVLNMRTTLMGNLSTLDLHPRLWGPDDFLEWMEFAGNPERCIRNQENTKRSYSEHDSVKAQTFQGTVLRVRPQELLFGDGEKTGSTIVARCLSALEYPRDTDIAEVSGLIGDALRPEMQYPCPFVLTLGIMVLDFDGMKGRAELKGARATSVASSPMARFMPELQTKKRDWDIVNESFASGEGLVRMYHQVVLFDDVNSIDQSTRTAEQLWRSKEYRLVVDRYMQLQAWFSTFPMSLTRSMQRDLVSKQRFVSKTVSNATSTAPVVAEWQGFGAPYLTLWGRRGQFMGVDFFANPEGNYNIAIAAGSGAGKSVLANELMSNVLGQGGRAWAIDAGRSYENSCRINDGQFIEFSPGQMPNFNPFAMINDTQSDDEALRDAVVMIAGIINSMAAPDSLLSDYQQGIVEQVVQDEIEANGIAGSITGVYERLIEFKNNQTGLPEEEAGRLAQAMRSYTRDGINGGYFEGGNPVRFERDFVVLELDGLSANPRLQSTVLMIVMFQITQAMYLDRSMPKIVLIDEAWALMRDGATAKFIETGYRRARKYRGKFITITQSFNDYYKSDAARAAFENSDWKISLRQSEETWASTFAENRFVANDMQQRFLRSLRTEAGKYSEVFIKMPQGWGVGRLILDPFSLLQYSSKAEDYEAIRHYRQQGLTVADAIDAVLHDRQAGKEALQ